MTTPKSFRLGLIARADKTGLGYQTKAYYDHLQPDKTLVIDISDLNGNEQHYDWYPDAEIIRGIPRTWDLAQWLKNIDVLLTAESPYNYELYDICSARNIKTVCVYNYEFFDWFKYPHYPKPDMLIAPSKWHFNEIQEFADLNNIKHLYLHHPVDRNVFKFTMRETPTTMHVAGKPAANDRNGTEDYLFAVNNGRVITQDKELARKYAHTFPNAKFYTNIEDAYQIYQIGNIMVLPRRYGGNCLPLNEALSCGLPVIMPDISPNNELLPQEWLVKAKKTSQFEPRHPIDIYSVGTGNLREVIDWFKYTDMAVQSLKANEIAESISWRVLQPKWIEALQGVLE